MIGRFFRSRKKLQYLDERIIWGLWAPRGLRLTYKGMAAHLRVPMCVLVGHILSQWLAQNSEALLLNEEERVKYGEYLARKYLASPEARYRAASHPSSSWPSGNTNEQR